jgi:hypothetical protein
VKYSEINADCLETEQKNWEEPRVADMPNWSKRNQLTRRHGREKKTPGPQIP